MKIIDILNKIANGEEPPEKILYEGIEYEWWESEYCKDYHNDIEGYLIDSHIITDILNDEVEILETTITYKPEKIVELNMFGETDFFDYRLALNQTRRKINEIIDYIQKE